MGDRASDLASDGAAHFRSPTDRLTASLQSIFYRGGNGFR